MREPRDDRHVPPAAGICRGCRQARALVNDRGSIFVLCGRSRTDARYPRYPSLPVVSCHGFEPTESFGEATTDPA